jgi:Integrase core domain
VVKTPVPAPKANAIAVHRVRAVRNECFDHILIVSRRHLERVVRDYVTHYDAERPHRSLELAAPGAAHQARGSPSFDILRVRVWRSSARIAHRLVGAAGGCSNQWPARTPSADATNGVNSRKSCL